MHLGMIPSWQLSLNPGVNIKLNDHVQFPPGFDQRTIQPVGAYYTAARIAQPNLGSPATSRIKRFLTTPLFGSQLNGLGADSWPMQHRAGLLLAGVGLVLAAGLGLTARALK